jgi:DNA-binding NarL/FixJ family response regulator
VTIRVLVVDDQELLRTAFGSLIDAEDDMEVVGEAAEGAEAAPLATSASPDVIVMDVRMPTMDGIEATRRITASGEDGTPRVLILTTFDLDEYVFEAMRAGASGFVLKSRPLEELLTAIRVVAAGEALLAPSVTRRLIAHFASQPQSPLKRRTDLGYLTDGEREVLVLIAQGLSNAELAETADVALVRSGPGGASNSGTMYVASPALLRHYGISPSIIDATTLVLTSRPGVEGLRFAVDLRRPAGRQSDHPHGHESEGPDLQPPDRHLRPQPPRHDFRRAQAQAAGEPRSVVDPDPSVAHFLADRHSPTGRGHGRHDD